MRTREKLAFLLLSVFITLTTHSQTVEETYPKTLWCPNDTFLLKYQGHDQVYPYKVSREDEMSPGTDAKPNIYTTIYYGKDSLRLTYHNKIPYAHITYINFESPKGKTKLRFHYNDLACLFPDDYMQKNMGNVQFDIPESYELANIIWTLSPSGQRATDLNKQGDYYKRVTEHFKPFLNHAVFKSLDYPDTLYARKYYDFRENSFAFNFANANAGKNIKLLFNGPYYYVFGDEMADSSLFGKRKSQVEDFAMKSGFRKFYKQNADYYQKELQRQQALLPVKQMWNWLEQEFPGRKYQSYRIVSSPLIGGSHSTQRYATWNKTQWFGENVMFVCGSERYDRMKDITEKQKEGLYSGVIFTEIDHNYVNPATNKFQARIDSIFSNRGFWVKSDINSDYYDAPVSVFNEYMTHAIFCLYILDNYDKATADYVVGERESLMVGRRNFIKFKEFDQELIKLRNTNKNLKVVELYPMILDWCGNVLKKS